MTPDYIPDPSRFIQHQDDLIAFGAMVIVGLCFFIIWIITRWIKDNAENRKALMENTIVLNKIYGALNDKK